MADPPCTLGPEETQIGLQVDVLSISETKNNYPV